MSVFSKAITGVTDGKKWVKNPLLVIGLTPSIIKAGFSDDDLFSICQKQARARLVEVHSDRTGTESDEQRELSAAFGQLKEREVFDRALAELRSLASAEQSEITRIRREVSRLQEESDAALEQAAVVSKENAITQSQSLPIRKFLQAWLQVAGMKIRRKERDEWAKPGSAMMHGLDQRVAYTFLWAQPTSPGDSGAVPVSDLVQKTRLQAQQTNGFPWTSFGSHPKKSFEYVFGEHKHLKDTSIPELQRRYAESFDDLLSICTRMDGKRRNPSKVFVSNMACGLRVSVISPDGNMYMSLGGDMGIYRIFGSLDGSRHQVQDTFEIFGDAGFIEVPWDTAIKHLSPILMPGWLMVGMRLKEVSARSTLTQRPTIEMLSNMPHNPFVVLGKLLDV